MYDGSTSAYFHSCLIILWWKCYVRCTGSFLSPTRYCCSDAPSRVRFRDILIYYGTAFLALFNFKWRIDHLTKTIMRQTLLMELLDSRFHLSPMITHLDLHFMVSGKNLICPRSCSIIQFREKNNWQTFRPDCDNFIQRTTCRPNWENLSMTTRLTGDRHAFCNRSIPASRRLAWGSRARYVYDVPTLLLEGSNTPRYHRIYHRDRPAGVSWCSVFGCWTSNVSVLLFLWEPVCSTLTN